MMIHIQSQSHCCYHYTPSSADGAGGDVPGDGVSGVAEDEQILPDACHELDDGGGDDAADD